MARGKVGSRPGTNSRTGSRAGTGGGNTSKYVAAPPSKRLMRNGLEAPETPEAERASVPGGRPPVPPSNNVKSLMRRAFRQEEEGDAGLLQIGQPVENDDVNLIQHIVVVPTKEEIKMQLKDLRSDYAKVRQGAVDRIGVVARDNFDNPEFQKVVVEMMSLLKTEKPTTPVARSLVSAAAVMTPGSAGARAAYEPYIPELLTIIEGARSIKQKGSLLIMNLATVKACREILLQKGAVPLLIKMLKTSLEEEDDPASMYHSHLVGALCNFSNAGDEEKQAIHDAGAEDVLVKLVSLNIDNTATQRAALLLQTQADIVPGAKDKILKLVEAAEILRPVTKRGERGRHDMHPVKQVQVLCQAAS